MRFRYEWDEFKNNLNYKKHGIRFEEAILIFGDPNGLETRDLYHPQERYLRIGFNSKTGVLVVVYSEKTENLIRIISARKATTKEARIYEERIQF